MTTGHDHTDTGPDDARTENGDGSGPADARAARSKVLKGAHAAFNQEFSAIPCTLRNLSGSGARLIFEGGWFVPDRFTLHVDIDGYKVECERVWQKGSECGVRFVGEKIMTGKARQQVLTPEPVVEAATDRRPTFASAPRSSAQAGPRPALSPRSGGFGRRTR